MLMVMDTILHTGAAACTGSAQSVFQDKKPVGKQASNDKPAPSTIKLAIVPAHLSAKWTGTIDTQIGKQEYVYTIESSQDKLLGSAAMKLEGNDFRSELTNIKLDGKKVAFDENLKFNDADLVITYSGELDGDEMKLTRKVGDFATEDFIAKRSK